MEDIVTVFPFPDTLRIFQMKGRHLIDLFEFAVAKLGPTNLDHCGRFLQVSGFKVNYNLSEVKGHRVLDLRAFSPHSLNGSAGEYEYVKDEDVYKVVIPAYLLDGGEGYNMIQTNSINIQFCGTKVSDAVARYVQTHSPINHTIFNHPTQLRLL